MSPPSRVIKRTAIPLSGYVYQNFVGLGLLCDWLDDPGLFDWVQFEADDDEIPQGLDDLVAQRTDGTFVLLQVKFTVDSQDSRNALTWGWLLDHKPKGRSLLQKWCDALFEIGAERVHTAALITNRVPSREFEGTIDASSSRVKLDSVDAAVRTQILQQLGGEGRARAFFDRFEYRHSYQGAEALERTVVDRFDISRVNRVGATSYAYGTGQVTDWQRYDKLGNVCAHFMRGNDPTGFTYNGRAGCGLNVETGTVNGDMTGSPHQVRQVGAFSNFVYDSHGNQTFADSASSDSLDRTIRYNVADQAHEIFKGPAAAPLQRARFWYDPSGARYKREDTGNGVVGTRRTLYVGNLEIVSENGTTTYKRYIGGVLVQNVVNGIAANRYLFQDHQGSLVKATNEAGTVLEGGGFNAYGERRVNGSATAITSAGLASTNRGYTGHEMLDGLDVIHMNGRIYDPTLARFLQPDPVIQAPDNPQNWNAYTYVFNNPYRYTDPSGMIGVEERQWLATAVAIAVSFFAPVGGLIASTAAGGNALTLAIVVAGGAASGGIAGGSQGAVSGAFSAALFFGVGEAFAGVQGASGTGFLGSGFTSGQFAAKVVTHGIAGGVMSALQGGNFGHGFLAAAGAQFASPAIDKIGGGAPSYAGMRVAAAALIGGTISVLTGGKFANGALTAAFSRAFNDEIHRIVSREEMMGKQTASADINDYDRNDPTFHEYRISSRLCTYDSQSCDARSMASIVEPDSAPRFGSVRQGPNVLHLNNLIQHWSGFAADGSFYTINLTDASHDFHAGAVVSRLIVRDGAVFLETHGFGYGGGAFAKYANYAAGYVYFSYWHAQSVQSAKIASGQFNPRAL